MNWNKVIAEALAEQPGLDTYVGKDSRVYVEIWTEDGRKTATVALQITASNVVVEAEEED